MVVLIRQSIAGGNSCQPFSERGGRVEFSSTTDNDARTRHHDRRERAGTETRFGNIVITTVITVLLRKIVLFQICTRKLSDALQTL